MRKAEREAGGVGVLVRKQGTPGRLDDPVKGQTGRTVIAVEEG